MKLTKTLLYKGHTFYFVGVNEDGDRIYESPDNQYIITAPTDYDGSLIGMVSRADSNNDDRIRYFNCETGLEEK